jgi:S-(hydroxymethyl)glutathione dehydrogenase / alcohol dehydrogenase
VAGARQIVTMAPVLRAVGEPMALEEVTVAAPGPNEVRVRMVASGVCHSCLHVADGSHSGLPLPIVLGDEGAGVVEAVGANCTRVRVGDPVILSWVSPCGWCRFCAVGRPALCVNGAPAGYLTDGTTRMSARGEPVHHLGPATYAPFAVVPESAAIRIDPAMPLDRAALVGCAVATGVGAVVNTARARPGDSLAVFGCGGVGLNAVQGGVIVGADPVVGVDVLAGRRSFATKLGATAVVDASAPEAVQQLRELSGGGFDVTIVSVGSTAALAQAWEVTGRGGICVLVGKPPDGARLGFDPQSLLAGERRLSGSTYGSSRPSVDFPRLVNLYLHGRLKLDELITRRYRLDEANAAFDALRDGDQARGLIVH